MRKLWSAVFAAVLVGSVGTASAQMHGGAGGWHGGRFHDGGLSHHERFHHHTKSGLFLGVPAFWWGAPYYPDYYPASRYDGSFALPAYGEPGPMTYIQQGSTTTVWSGAAQTGGGEYSYYCTEPAGYYPQVKNCANGWLKIVPVVVDDHAPVVPLKSKELNNAEQFAKANGCLEPKTVMTLSVTGLDNFETFAVACLAAKGMRIRCDSGECRAV